MSRDFNRVILMGRLARDPDIRNIQSGQKAARFTVCCGRQWKNKTTGEMQSHTDFIQVTAWGFVADVCEKYMKKGSLVLLEGRISTRDYDDTKTGEHKWVTEVQAESVSLLPSGSKGQVAQAQESGAGSAGQPSSPHSDGMYQDDFPLDFSEMDGGSSGSDVEIPF